METKHPARYLFNQCNHVDYIVSSVSRESTRIFLINRFHGLYCFFTRDTRDTWRPNAPQGICVISVITLIIFLSTNHTATNKNYSPYKKNDSPCGKNYSPWKLNGERLRLNVERLRLNVERLRLNGERLRLNVE